MRYIAMLLIAAGAIVTAACSSVLSLESAAGDATPNADLVGVWMAPDDDDPMVVKAGEGGVLQISYGSARLIGRTFRMGEATMIELSPKDGEPLHVPAHGVARYWVEGDLVRWAFLDSEWLRARIVERGVAAMKVRDALVITAGGEAVRKVFSEYGADRRAYKEVNTFRRVR